MFLQIIRAVGLDLGAVFFQQFKDEAVKVKVHKRILFTLPHAPGYSARLRNFKYTVSSPLRIVMRKLRSRAACAVNIFPIQRRSFENVIRQLFRNLREICRGFWNPPEQYRSDARLSQYLHQGTRFWELFRKSKSGEKLLLVAVTSNPRSSCDPTFRNARNLGTAPIQDSSDSGFDRTF